MGGENIKISDALFLVMIDDLIGRELDEARRRIYYELLRRLTLIHELDQDMDRSKTSKQENASRVYYATRRHHPDEDELGRHL